MNFVICLSEGSSVAIGLGVIPILIGSFVMYKAKSDKADIMTSVDEKIEEKIAPVERKLEKHEEVINQIVTKQSVIDVKIDVIGENVTDIKKLIGKIFDVLDSKKDK